MDKKYLGYYYVLIAQIFFVVWPIFSTFAFQYYNLPTVLTLWFGTAAMFSFLMIVFQKRATEYSLFKKHWRYILLSASFNAGSIFFGFYTLRMLGPSLHGFLSKIGILMVIFFGVVILKEKFNLHEALSAIIILTGVVIISYSTGAIIVIGVLLIFVHAFFFASARYIVKSKLEEISPLFLSHYRALIVALYMLLFAVFTDQLRFSLSPELLFTTIPSIFTVIFGHILIYKAYKIMEISKIELITAMQPFLVLIVSFFVFGEVLTLYQFFGGILIIVGVVWLIYAKKGSSLKTKILSIIKNFWKVR